VWPFVGVARDLDASLDCLLELDCDQDWSVACFTIVKIDDVEKEYYCIVEIDMNIVYIYISVE
jgi:hypothetical protein